MEQTCTAAHHTAEAAPSSAAWHGCVCWDCSEDTALCQHALLVLSKAPQRRAAIQAGCELLTVSTESSVPSLCLSTALPQ